MGSFSNPVPSVPTQVQTLFCLVLNVWLEVNYLTLVFSSVNGDSNSTTSDGHV